MSRGVDVQKLRSWQERIARFRASGLTVGRFCGREGVSVHTFHYWARRVGGGPRSKVAEADRGDRGLRVVPEARARGPAAQGEAGEVRFRLNSAVEVCVPASCLEVIRCLAHCLQAPAEHTSAFQEVVVSRR